MEPVTLKTLSMNCWAVPFLSKDISPRLTGIGRYLDKSDIDVAFLQEVWTRKSFELVEAECKDRFPYSRCFFSGRVGTSGICVFSRFPIVDTFFHPFMLNGYWYAIAHGDSHGCKGIGFLRIMVGSVAVNCFVTHLHAEYDRKNDTYYAHRIAQAYELLKFAGVIVPTGCDNMQKSISLISGDLNLEPQDLGIKLLCAGGFRDPWKELHGDDLGATCDLPDNCYSPSASLPMWPNGRRIDYTLYRSGNLHCEVVDSKVLSKKLPDMGLPFSDHEAVVTTFKLSCSGMHSVPETPSPVRIRKAGDVGPGENDNVLLEARQVFRQAIKDCAKFCMRWIYGILFLLLIGLLCILFAPSMITSFTVPIYFVLLIASGLHYFMVMRQEHVHLIEIAHHVDNDLKNIKGAGAETTF